MDSAKPIYSQEEVNEILKRALSQEAGRERVLSHDELVEIATEAGIERESLDRAMAELAQENARALASRVETAEIAAERRVQLKRFGAALTSHGVLNGFLYVICVHFTGGTWYVWPLLGSGVLLALQLRHVLFPYDKVLRRRKELERERERQRKRQEREAWKQRIFGIGAVSADNVKRFESVVQEGVSALLAIAERKLAEHHVRKADKPRDE
jgi:DNA-binding phage protein